MAEYEKQTWADGDAGRPLSAARLTHLETQFDRAIETVTAGVSDPESPLGAELSASIADRAAAAVDLREWGRLSDHDNDFASFANAAQVELKALNDARIAAGNSPIRTPIIIPFGRDGRYELEDALIPESFGGFIGEYVAGRPSVELVDMSTASAAIYKVGGVTQFTRDVTLSNLTIECRHRSYPGSTFTTIPKGITLQRTVGMRYSGITVKNSVATSIAFDQAIDCVGRDITIYNAGRGLIDLDFEFNFDTISGHSALGMGTGSFPYESHVVHGLTVIGTGFAGLFWEHQGNLDLPYPTPGGVKIVGGLIVNANIAFLDAGTDGADIDMKVLGARRNAVHVDKTFLSAGGGKGGRVRAQIEKTGNWSRVLTGVRTVAGSDVITGMSGGRFTTLEHGARVIGAGIPNPVTITEIIDQQNARISKPATATASGVTVTIGHGPRVVADAVTTSGSTTLTAPLGYFSKHFETKRYVTGAGIPAGAYIASVTDSSTVVLSAAATATAGPVSITLGDYIDGGDIFIGEAGEHYSFDTKAHDSVGPHVNTKSTSKWGKGISFNDEVWRPGDAAYKIQGTGMDGGPIRQLTIGGSVTDGAADGVRLDAATDLLTVKARIVENAGVGLRTIGARDMSRAALTGDVRGNTGGGFVNAHTISADSRVDLLGGDTTGPSNLRVTSVGNGSVTLALTEPIPSGDVTDYSWQYREAPAGAWTSFSHTAAPTPSVAVTGLTNGVAYQFRAAKVTAGGTGSYTAGPVTATPVAPILYSDSFTRADNTSTPGSTDGGSVSPTPWLVLPTGGAVTFGIASSSVRPTAGGNGLMYIDPAKDHGTIRWTMPFRNGAQLTRALVFRGVDEANFVALRVYSAYVRIVTRVAGTETTILEVANTAAAGDRFQVTWTTTQVKVWINGALILTQATTHQASATRIGLWGSATADGQTRFDDFAYSEQTVWPDLLST